MFCDSLIGHACQNAVRPTGESARDSNRNTQNFQSLPNRQYDNSLFLSSENWKGRNTKMNKKVQLETSGGKGLELTSVEDLLVPLEHMSANSLNFWLCKFICGVGKQTGERNPPKTLYLFVCSINRHLGNVKGGKAFNPLTPGTFCQNRFFWTFWRFWSWIVAKLASIWWKTHW